MSTPKVNPLRCQTCRLARRAEEGACPFKHDFNSAGTTLFDQGRVPERVVYLRRGHLVLTASSTSGRDLSCAVRGPNTMLGLESILERSMSYEVRALTDAVYCYLDVDSFKAWIGPLDSPLGSVLRFSTEEAIRRAGERHAVEGTALRRVARFLAETAREMNDGQPPDIPLGVLANVLAMRPETLSRALADLRRSGALGNERSLRIVDEEKLRLAAE